LDFILAFFNSFIEMENSRLLLLIECDSGRIASSTEQSGIELQLEGVQRDL